MSGENYNLNPNLGIRHDLRELKAAKKRMLISAAVFGVILLAWVLIFALSWGSHFASDGVNREFLRFGIIFIDLMPIAFLAFLICLSGWCTCWFYLHKLEKRNMIVPKAKEEYHNDLRELVKGEVSDLPNERFFTLLRPITATAIALLVYGFSIWIAREYRQALFFIVMSFLLYVFWIVWPIMNIRQSLSKKYKDETDPDPMRRSRLSLVTFLSITILAGLVSWFWVSTIRSMAAYADRSTEEADEQLLNGIATAANCAYENLKPDANLTVTIRFTQDGFTVEGAAEGRSVDLSAFEEEFRQLLVSTLDPISLGELSKRLRSRHYDVLESYVITINGLDNKFHVLGVPERKGVEPFEILRRLY